MHAESVAECRPTVLAERRRRLDNMVKQMVERGIEFSRALDPPEHDFRMQMEAVALLLVQRADSLVATLAQLERLTEEEVERFAAV